MSKSKGLPKSLTTVTLFSKMLAVILLVFIFPLVGFYVGAFYQKQADITLFHPQQSQTLLGTFFGKLPCADCSGLQTTVSLYKDSLTNQPSTYTLSQTYLGKSTSPTITHGDWVIVKGNKQDPNATLYFLSPENPNNSWYFLAVNDTTLQMMDVSGNAIQNSPFNYLLKKQ